MVAEIALTLMVGAWTPRSPEAMVALDNPETLDTCAHEASESYYSTYSAPNFAATVWTNNAHIVVICVTRGIMEFLPLYMLYQNAVGMGRAGATTADHDMLGVFLSFISPHDLLELTYIFIADAVGLKLFWTILVPDRRGRTATLVVEGRALIMMAVGLTAALTVAGFIEAFVTPAPIPWLVKAVTGANVLTLLQAYILILSRSVVAVGSTGDLEEDEAGYVQPETG